MFLIIYFTYMFLSVSSTCRVLQFSEIYMSKCRWRVHVNAYIEQKKSRSHFSVKRKKRMSCFIFQDSKNEEESRFKAPPFSTMQMTRPICIPFSPHLGLSMYKNINIMHNKCPMLFLPRHDKKYKEDLIIFRLCPNSR